MITLKILSSLAKTSPTNGTSLLRRFLCQLSDTEYDRISSNTLSSLSEKFEELPEKYQLHKDFDVEHSYGVLKINFGPDIGTYVINRQAPNKQIWLSSPISGAKRYDFILPDKWVYKHDKKSLQQLLSEEISQLVGEEINL